MTSALAWISKPLLAMLLGGALFMTACGNGPSPESKQVSHTVSPFTIGPIYATFQPKFFRTSYEAVITPRELGQGGYQGDVLTPADLRIGAAVYWTLKLELISGDAGQPDPELLALHPAITTAGAVDPGCNNAGNGVSAPYRGVIHEEQGFVTSVFNWYHPDALQSSPPGHYHCDHHLMGPHGHEGVIEVRVVDHGWECTAIYAGTHTGNGSDDHQRTFPTCRRIPS